MNNAAGNIQCPVCNEREHEVLICPKFMSTPINEKWDIVKRLRLCFQCLGNNHQRDSCGAPKCQYCFRPHASILHNSLIPNRKTDAITENGHTLAAGTNLTEYPYLPERKDQPPPRCYLPIVRATVINEEKKMSVITILDTGSELNVINTKLYNKLGLKGTPITVTIVGITGKTMQKSTKVVDLIVEDRMGLQTSLQCIILDKTCGNALQVDKEIFSLFGDIKVPERELVTTGGGGGGEK